MYSPFTKISYIPTFPSTHPPFWGSFSEVSKVLSPGLQSSLCPLVKVSSQLSLCVFLSRHPDGKTEVRKEKDITPGPPLDSGWVLPTGLLPVASVHPTTYSAPLGLHLGSCLISLPLASGDTLKWDSYHTQSWEQASLGPGLVPSPMGTEQLCPDN